MSGWTKLHRKTNDSLVIAELIDEQPDAAILWFMLIAASGVWGRFPADTRQLRHRVCGLSERLSGEVLGAAVDVLRRGGLLQLYRTTDTNVQVLVIPSHFEHNPNHAWHRVGEPEFSHPPGWEPPKSLLKYLRKVKAGAYKDKQTVEECEKFAVAPGAVPEPLPEDYPKDDSQGALLRQRLHTEKEKEQEKEQEKEGREPVPDDRYASGGELPDDLSALKQNYPKLRQALWGIGNWQVIYRDRWLADVIGAIEGADPIRDEAHACELLKQHPPMQSEKNLPAKWLERVSKSEAQEPADPAADAAREREIVERTVATIIERAQMEDLGAIHARMLDRVSDTGLVDRAMAEAKRRLKEGEEHRQ